MARQVLQGLTVTDMFRSVGLMHRALDYHLQRHSVISSNVANVDTPGFRPQELLRTDDAGGSAPRALATTDGAHFQMSGAAISGLVVEASEDTTVSGGLDGNSVSLEREMSKLAANDLRYDGAVKMITGKLGLLRYVAGDGSGG
jgi:flagellar basal-body rod protein FlgB